MANLEPEKLLIVRQYTFQQYKNYISEKDAENLEKETFEEANKRTENMNKHIIDIDILDYKLQAYIQTYCKVIEYLKNNEKNLRKDLLKNIAKATREELNPEKWTTLKNNRNNNNTVIKRKSIHRCKCGSWYTTYQQLQTASADESMRVSVVCLDCNNHWKYS